MKSKFINIIFLVFFLSSFVNAQKYTLSGYIKDKASREDLIGVNIVVKELKIGTISNRYGFYSITLPKGNYTIEFSFLGYKTQTEKIHLTKSIKKNILFEEASYMTKEVVISSERTDQNIKGKEMSVIKMPVERIKEVPVLFGETDVLKTLQLLPGVQSGGEGDVGLYVRGGGPDQNLIMLDESVVYNASHLMGFVSVFNADAINDVKLIKGGMPAEYGGRLSSVLDISMKNGNNQSYHLKGGLGVVSARLTAEGPIVKGKSSFLISGRRTFVDALMKPFTKGTRMNGFGYYFYDLNFKSNYLISDKNRIYLSAYLGKDIFSIVKENRGLSLNIPWGNAIASVRWNHLFSDKFFMNATLAYSQYDFSFRGEQKNFEFILTSGLQDWNTKVDFNYLAWVRHDIKFGINQTFHTFHPSSATAKIGETNYDSGKTIDQYANELAAYLGDNFDLTEKLSIYGGIRATFFQQLGPYMRFVKNNIGETIDTISYRWGEEIVHYAYLEPRFSTRYVINDKMSLKASYTQNYQYVHLANIASMSLPTDLWVSSSTLVKPQFSTQYAIGFFNNFFKDKLETSVETYYKKMDHMIAYKDGAQPDDNMQDNPDNNFTFGQGKSYGIEFFINKKLGKFTGWIGYTWSVTNRQFDEINKGEWYPAKYDRRHDLSIVSSYHLNKRWSFSATFVYATGNAMTMPISRYFIGGKMITEYGARNSYRMNPYHRLDISVTLKGKQNKRFKSYWNFSVYNVYNRQNPYFIYFGQEGSLYDGNLKITPYQVSLFPVIPSISWNFEF